jgi:hypothetical protein
LKENGAEAVSLAAGKCLRHVDQYGILLSSASRENGSIMENTKTKKELQAEYKERKIIGGVFAVKNTLTGKMLLDSSADMRGSINRFEFSKKTGSCMSMKLQKDWKPTDAPPFIIEVLEELEKGNNQTDAEFKSDLLTLKEIWLEKLADSDLYN